MAEEGGDEDDERRDHPRALTDLAVSLSGDGGAVIDPEARALDVNPEGFRVVTKGNLKQGGRVSFILALGDGRPVTGEGEIVWARADGWGGCEAGIKIGHMSWSDARRLRGQVYVPGFDFAALAWLAAKAVVLLVIVVGLHNVMFHQPHARAVLVQLLPVLGVLIVVGAVIISVIRG